MRDGDDGELYDGQIYLTGRPERATVWEEDQPQVASSKPPAALVDDPCVASPQATTSKRVPLKRFLRLPQYDKSVIWSYNEAKKDIVFLTERRTVFLKKFYGKHPELPQVKRQDLLQQIKTIANNNPPSAEKLIQVTSRVEI